MGRSRGRKRDKETQSPMLKVFKDIMQREHRDPEKANLLKNTRSRNQYLSSSRTSENSGDSSGTESKPTKVQPYMQEMSKVYNQYRTVNAPFQDEKADTWTFSKRPSDIRDARHKEEEGTSKPVRETKRETTNKGQSDNEGKKTAPPRPPNEPSNKRKKTDDKSRKKSKEKTRDSVKNKKKDKDKDRDRDRDKDRDKNRDKDRDLDRDQDSNEEIHRHKKSDDDTCSCVSCALKKIAGNEYSCVFCLSLLFFLSVFIAFFLVFRSIPCVPKNSTSSKSHEVPKDCAYNERTKYETSDILKAKVEELISGKDKRSIYDDSNVWDDNLPSGLGVDSQSDHNDDFRNENMQWSTLEHEKQLNTDLSKVLDENKVLSSPVSERLLNFYKKLIATDAQIKKIKKSFPNPDSFPLINEMPLNPYRMKRSLRKWFWRTTHMTPWNNHKNVKSIKEKERKKEKKVKKYVYLEDDLFKDDVYTGKQVTKDWEKNMLKGHTEIAARKLTDKVKNPTREYQYDISDMTQTAEDKLHKQIYSNVPKGKPNSLKVKREDVTQPANRSASAILIERKRFFLKLSPFNMDRRPKFPKCSHIAKNKINSPLSETSFDNDVDDLRYEIDHRITKQYVLTKNKNEKYNENEKLKAVKGNEDEKDAAIKSNEDEKAAAKKGNVKAKPKHHNKFIYYTNDDEELEQTSEITSKQTKSCKTAPTREDFKAQKIHKPSVTHNTKTQKIYPKKKLIHNIRAQRIEDSESEIGAHKYNDEEMFIPAENKLHTSHSDSLLNNDYLAPAQETVNMPLFDLDTNPVDFSADIYLSTIQPYFNKLRKQTIHSTESLTDTEPTSMQRKQDNVLLPTSMDQIYNKLSRSKIFKMLKKDKQKRFSMNQDLITGKSLDVDTISTKIIQPKNSTLSSTEKDFDSHELLLRLPMRKLLQQTDEPEERLRYEDLKEVYSGDIHEELNKEVERKRRQEEILNRVLEEQMDRLHTQVKTTNNPGVYNPNWKGPMPLYPDEMNNILPKLPENPTYQGSIQLPQTMKTVQSDADESGIGDIQYMEDYLENNRDKLDKMAQAYSDYGVLEEKKVCKEGKNDAAKEINKMSTKKRSIMDEQYYTKVNKHGRPHVAITKPMPAPPQHSTITTSDPLSVESDSPKPEDIDIVFKNKGKYSEGIRFEYKPGCPYGSKGFLWKLIHDLKDKFYKYGHHFGEVFNNYQHVKIKDKTTRYTQLTIILYPISENGTKSRVHDTTPIIDNRYKYLNFNRFKPSLKPMRNNTLNGINHLNMLQQLDIGYDATNPKELKTDSLHMEFDTSEEQNSDLPQPITEYNLLQQPETSYIPFDEYNTSNKEQTNDVQSNTNTQSDFSYNLLPITDSIQSDMINENDWLAPLSTEYADDSLETKDISLTKHTENFETNITDIVTESEVIWPAALSRKYKDISPETKDVSLTKYTENTKTGYNNTVTESSEAVLATTKDQNVSLETKYVFLVKCTDSIEVYNNNILPTITTFKVNNKITSKVHATHKTKEKSNQNTMAVYLDELLDSNNYNIQKHPCKEDNEEVIIYTEDEIPDENGNSRNWLKSLNRALNTIAMKSYKKNEYTTVHTVQYNKNNSDVKTDLKRCRLAEDLKSESFKFAYDHKNTKHILPIRNEMINKISFKPSYLESSKVLKTEVFRRKRDIKSIDFDIEKEIKDKQVKNISNFSKRSNTSYTSKSTVFSDYKDNIYPSKGPFSNYNYSNMPYKNIGSNKGLKFYKINETASASTNKGKHRVKRNAQSYTQTTSQIVKTDLDRQLIIQKPEIALLSNEIQILTTNIPSDEGNRTKDLNVKQMDIGYFFQMVSEWFKTLAGVPQLNENDPQAHLKFNKTVTPKSNSTQNIVYSMYDSDMIDNIRHGSRVLMYVKDDSKSEKRETEAMGETSTDIVTDHITVTRNVTKSTASPNNTKEDANTETQGELKLIKQNKTVVKRSASENTHLFWNDLYDDEYGVEDPLEKTLRERHGNDLVRKSGTWIQDKVKRLAHSIKKVSRDELDKLSGNSKDMDKSDSFARPGVRSHKIYKRGSAAIGKQVPSYLNFPSPISHMKEVCRQASQAIQMTRNIVVRSNENDTEAATTMMQKLVKLMSDLINFQVLQRTCITLPQDLRDFLDWLTTPPSTEEKSTNNPKFISPDEGDIIQDHTVELASMSEKDYNHDVRSECLGSINAVQDLIHQYSEMNDEEKTRIAGVKGYLEDQLAFLIKQLISLDEVSTETSFDENSASGLELNYNIKNLKPHEKYKTNNQLTKIRKKRYKPKIIHKFIKNTTMKKHTTQTNFDSLQMTEPSARDKIKINNLLQNVDDKMQKDNEFQELSDELVEKVDDFQAPVGDKTETGSDRMKRNIKDVYYKAVHDATKYTEKTMHPHYAGTKT